MLSIPPTVIVLYGLCCDCSSSSRHLHVPGPFLRIFIVSYYFSTLIASWTSVPVWFLGWLCQFPGYIHSSITTSLSSWTYVPVSFLGWLCQFPGSSTFSTFLASWTSVPVSFLGWFYQFPGFFIFDESLVLDFCPCFVPWLAVHMPVSWRFFGDSLAFLDDLFVFYSICSVFIHSDHDTYSSGSTSHSLTSNLGGLLYIFGTLSSSFRSFWSAVPSGGAHPVHPCSEAAWAPVSLVSDSTAVETVSLSSARTHVKSPTDESFMNAYPERMNRMILKAARSTSCQFAQNPGVIHWRTVKRILRYLTNPLSSNPVQYQRTKLIDILWSFVREAIAAGW